jgi:hypothetical protein
MRRDKGKAGQALHRTTKQIKLLLHQQHGHTETTKPQEDIMKLTTQQQEALQALVDYVLVNERSHFMEHVEEGNPPENHIYTQAVILNELRGHHES